MSDPHVQSIRYRIQPGRFVVFTASAPLDFLPGILIGERAQDPHPVTWTTRECRITLQADYFAKIALLQHYAKVEEARAAVEPHLEQWQIHASVTTSVEGPPLISFEDVDAVVVDRASKGTPPLKQDAALHAETAGAVVSVRPFPDPPQRFTVSPDVQTMWTRWEAYREEREPLASMAYMCLTVLEVSVAPGKRMDAAARYGFSGTVLTTFARLVSDVGDERGRRKAVLSDPRPHTGAEVVWLHAVVKAMIRRAGEWAFDPSQTFTVLTMADFPSLA